VVFKLRLQVEARNTGFQVCHQGIGMALPWAILPRLPPPLSEALVLSEIRLIDCVAETRAESQNEKKDLVSLLSTANN
jgi:hypothetical protein